MGERLWRCAIAIRIKRFGTDGTSLVSAARTSPRSPSQAMRAFDTYKEALAADRATTPRPSSSSRAP